MKTLLGFTTGLLVGTAAGAFGVAMMTLVSPSLRNGIETLAKGCKQLTN